MNFKLALLFLFGFVALAAAVPLENTQENDAPVAADTEKPEAPVEEDEEAPLEQDEAEEENEDEEDETTLEELDNDEEDEDNEMTESEDPKRKPRPRPRGYWRATRVFKTVHYATCRRVRRFCYYRRGGKRLRRPCFKLRCCGKACRVRRFIYCRGRKCFRRSIWVAHKCGRRRCLYKPLRG